MPKDYLRAFDERVNELRRDTHWGEEIDCPTTREFGVKTQRKIDGYTELFTVPDWANIRKFLSRAIKASKQEGREEAVAYIRAHAERTDFTDKTIYSIDGFQLEAAKEQKV